MKRVLAWPTALCCGLFQVSHLVVAHITSRNIIELRIGHILAAVSSVVLLVAFGALLDCLVPPRPRALIGIVGLLLNVLATDYLVLAHVTFDPLVSLANWRLMSSMAAFETAFDGITKPAPLSLSLGWLALSPLYVVLVLRSRTHQAGSRRGTTIAAIALLCTFFPARGYSELHGILWSSFLDLKKAEAAALRPGEYPLRRKHVAPSAAPKATPSHVPVLLLMVESFNARFLGHTHDGKPLLPVFERHMRDGLYVPRFYGNSIQTSRGHFATLFGLPPVSAGNVFALCRDTPLLGLPRVLAEQGYQTAYMQAHASVDFDGTRDFMSAHGFSVVESPVKIGLADLPFVWGWGPEDRLLYRDAFRRLDELHGQSTAPVFAVMATISSHMRFRVPKTRRTLFPSPRSLEERYLNAIHLADAQLEYFFYEVKKRPWLSDALIVITGDHSIPTGLHGVEYNEVGYYEESFRVPFLMLWPGHIAPRVVDDFEASQVDIAPTILDALGLLPEEHHFYGQSMLNSETKRPVPLVQPYNGEYLGAVHGGMKYLRRTRTGEELAFDLTQDPDEHENLLLGPTSKVKPDTLKRLRDATSDLEVVRAALRNNAVWPEND